MADIALGAVVRVEYDGFVGIVVGHYETREKRKGVVVQQVGTKVVHVYGVNRVTVAGPGDIVIFPWGDSGTGRTPGDR